MTQFTSIHHSFDINLAAKYGMAEAILIHHIAHWVLVNKRLNRNNHEGRTWTYQTLDEIAAHFPYLTKTQVFDLLDRLCLGHSRRSKSKDQEFEPVLLKGNFNKQKYDKTTWYAFVDESAFPSILANAKMEIGKCQNGDRQMPTPIPDTKPDTEPYKDTSLKVSSDKSAESAKASDKKKIVFTKEVTDLCESMLSEMRKVKPDYKFSKAQALKWCEQVDLMLRLDKRDAMTILELLRWVLADNFWRPKLFKPNPPKYLREKFDQLEMQMRTPKIENKPKIQATQYPSGWTPETTQQAEWARINTETFKREKAESNGALDHCYISNGFLNNKRDRTKDASIRVNPETFNRLIEVVSGAQYCGL